MKFIGKLILALFLALVGLYVAYFVYGNILTDNFYREGMEESGMYKVVVYNFRDYFHGRSDYEALSLDQLHDRGIISNVTYDYIKEGWYSYQPFTPQTPDDTLVLRLGLPLLGQYIYKGDLIAGPSDPDVVIQK